MSRERTKQPSSIPGLNARDLHALVPVARSGSLVNASAVLQTSQSALSRTITRVERRVGVRLLVRSTRRIEIWPAGREFGGQRAVSAAEERAVRYLRKTMKLGHRDAGSILGLSHQRVHQLEKKKTG